MALERNTTLEEELSATKEEVSIISVGGKFFHLKREFMKTGEMRSMCWGNGKKNLICFFFLYVCFIWLIRFFFLCVFFSYSSTNWEG